MGARSRGPGIRGKESWEAQLFALGRARQSFLPRPCRIFRRPLRFRASRFVSFKQPGGRAGLPAPRVVSYPPFTQWVPPTVWTTLALTIRIDGSSEHELVGASPFPRHWLFDASGQLVAKAGLADFDEWWRRAFGPHTPWGDEDSPVLLVSAETELERHLSSLIMKGSAKPAFRLFEAGDFVTRQGQPGGEVFLLLNGIVGVEVNNQEIAQVGPGAIVGERALLEEGVRTASLRALTRCRVAVAQGDQLDPRKLGELSEDHRRELRPSPGRVV